MLKPVSSLAFARKAIRDGRLAPEHPLNEQVNCRERSSYLFFRASPLLLQSVFIRWFGDAVVDYHSLLPNNSFRMKRALFRLLCRCICLTKFDRRYRFLLYVGIVIVICVVKIKSIEQGNLPVHFVVFICWPHVSSMLRLVSKHWTNNPQFKVNVVTVYILKFNFKEKQQVGDWCPLKSHVIGRFSLVEQEFLKIDSLHMSFVVLL